MAERASYRYLPHRRTQVRVAGQVPSPVKAADQAVKLQQRLVAQDKVLGALTDKAQGRPG